MFTYCGYELKIDLDDLDKHYRNGKNKLYACVEFTENKYASLLEMAKKYDGVHYTSLWRFINNGTLKEICPDLYNDCRGVINIHSSIRYKRKKLKDLKCLDVQF